MQWLFFFCSIFLGIKTNEFFFLTEWTNHNKNLSAIYGGGVKYINIWSKRVEDILKKNKTSISYHFRFFCFLNDFLFWEIFSIKFYIARTRFAQLWGWCYSHPLPGARRANFEYAPPTRRVPLSPLSVRVAIANHVRLWALVWGTGWIELFSGCVALFRDVEHQQQFGGEKVKLAGFTSS